MKIWTITTSQPDDGTATMVYTSEAEVDAHRARTIAASWQIWFGEDQPMPEDADEAWGILTDQVGFFDTVDVTEHDIYAPVILEIADMIAEFPLGADGPADPIDRARWVKDSIHKGVLAKAGEGPKSSPDVAGLSANLDSLLFYDPLTDTRYPDETTLSDWAGWATIGQLREWIINAALARAKGVV